MNDPSWKKKINCVRVFTESTQVFHIKIIRKLEYCLWTSNVVIFVFQWVFARKVKRCWKSSKWTLKLQITKKTHECNILIAWFRSYIICELWANHTHLYPQPALTCSKSTMDILEQCEICSKWIKHQKEINDVFLVSLWLNLNIFHKLFCCFCCCLWISKCELGTWSNVDYWSSMSTNEFCSN